MFFAGFIVLFQIQNHPQMKAIGIGFPGTGTQALKQALQQLGQGPCADWADYDGEATAFWLEAFETRYTALGTPAR